MRDLMPFQICYVKVMRDLMPFQICNVTRYNATHYNGVIKHVTLCNALRYLTRYIMKRVTL